MSTQPNLTKIAAYTYILCGWRTYSEIPLTGIQPLPNNEGNSEIVIQMANGPFPIIERAGRFLFEHSPECSFIKIENVAQFEIKNGQQIRVWPTAKANLKEIEIFLFGPAWATLCHQRGNLPLHASAIVARNRITAFAGPPGAGKSTTAALLNSLGYELIADDILPLSFDQNSMPGAWPYLRRLKLQSDPLIKIGLRPIEVVSETLDKEKYFVRPRHTNDDKWRRLERLYLLEYDVTDSCTPIEQLTGAEAVHALVDQTYHFNYVRDTRGFGEHLAFCSRLASKILVYRLRRSPSRDERTLGSLIRSHLDYA